MKIDDARQINPSSSIFFKEKKIGVIRDIELLDHSTGLMLTLAINNEVQIPKSVNVMLGDASQNQPIILSSEKMEIPYYEKRDTIRSN